MEKMIKTAGNFDIMAKTSYWVCVIGAVFCAVMAAVTLFVDETLFWYQTGSVSLGPLTLDFVPDGMLAPDIVRQNVVLGYLLCVIVLIFACMVIRVIRRILAPMAQGKPFDSTVSKNLSRLAVITLIAGGVYEIFSVVWQALVLQGYQIENFFNLEVIQGYTIEYRIDLWFVAVFVILQLMSYVFRYGEELQQLSDETL